MTTEKNKNNEDYIKAIEIRVINLQEDLQKKEEGVEKLKAQLVKLEEKLVSSQNESRGKIENLDNSLQERQKEIDRLIQERDRVQADLTNVRQELKELKQKLESSEAKAEVDKKEIEQLQQKIVQLENNRKKAIMTIIEVNRYFLNKKNYLISKNSENKAKILGEDWNLNLIGKNLEEMEEQKNALIKLIDDEREKQEAAFDGNKKYLKSKISEARKNIRNFYLTKGQIKESLKELEGIQSEWAASEDPVKHRSFLEVNKSSDLEEGIMHEIIQGLRVRIVGEEAIEFIEQILNKYNLRESDLGMGYSNFTSILRQMKEEWKVNEYENKVIEVVCSLGPRRRELDKLIDSKEEMPEVNDTIIELDKFIKSTQDSDEIQWLAYLSCQSQTNEKFRRCLKIVQEEAKNRLIKIKEIVESRGMIDTNGAEFEAIFERYKKIINRTIPKELGMIGEKFLTEIFEASQLLQQTQNAQIIQKNLI